MTEHNLENKIKLLRQIKPENEWKKSTRAFLLSEIQSADLEQSTEQVRNRLWIPVKLFRFRPVMATALVLIFTIVGCAYGFNISKRSLPGDMFWSVKVSLEKAQVTFSSLEEKVKLGTEFAGRRLEEMEEVTQNGDEDSVKIQKVAQAVENFKVHINETKEGLKTLEQEEPEKVAEISKEVQRKLEEYAKECDTETLAAVSDSTDEVTDEFEKELIVRIQEKIENARSLDTEFEAEIEQAESFLEEGRLVEALDKIQEVERIIEAEEIE